MEKVPVEIVRYKKEYAVYFERFNKEWIEEYFFLEETDKYVLENPEESILQHGGAILFAKQGDKIIGTVALKPVTPGVFELTKMAVDKQSRGIGAGKLLCIAAIEEAEKLHARQLILYSNTKQATAIKMYRQLGFIELPVEPGVYERANIKMEFPLKKIMF